MIDSCKAPTHKLPVVKNIQLSRAVTCGVGQVSLPPLLILFKQAIYRLLYSRQKNKSIAMIESTQV